jgi:TolB-like protein/Flp pilus assembly protein TadD
MPPPPPTEVLQELDRVVSSAGFASAGRLAPFLRFLVERALAGEPVKEVVAGVEVFGRPADYDPRLDPIVRVEARRLRARLAEYYAASGAGDPIVIELPRGGYTPVFTPATEAVPAAITIPRATGSGRWGRLEPALDRAVSSLPYRWRLALALGASLAVLIAIFVLARRQTPPSRPVVAVLPFLNLSGDKENEYFSDGLAEELTDRLAKAPGLRVVARSSAFEFKGRAEDLRTVGRKLNATAVVEGSVRRSGDRLRVAAQLIDVADGLHLWSETYERTMSDVFAIQDDIARSIAGALRVELRVGFAGGEGTAPPTSNIQAYELYLKGRRHFNQDALAGLELAADKFEQAIAADPKFALAHAQLAVDYGLLGYYRLREANEIWPKAKAAAERAIALDSRLAAGHSALGFELGMYEWKWAEAERELRLGVQRDPESADARVVLAVACLVPAGRLREASAELARALELDPESYLANVGAAYAFLAAGRYGEAIERYRRAVEINPSFGDTQWDLGMAYAYAGQKDAALKQFRLGGQIHEGGPWRPGATELALLGDVEAARRWIEETGGSGNQRPMFVAYGYGAMGDAGNAAAWLEKAFAMRDPQLVWIKADARFAKVRDDPRIAALIRKLGLP